MRQKLTLLLAFWLTASVNDVFLSVLISAGRGATHFTCLTNTLLRLIFDFLYTGTILGSFLAQQAVAIMLIALQTGEAVLKFVNVHKLKMHRSKHIGNSP